MEPTNPIRSHVLERIRTGSVRMRPRLYFLATGGAVLAIVVAAFLVSVALANVIAFDIRFNGHASLLGFGARGIGAFLSIFPWDLFMLDLILIASLLFALHRFRFGYRSPVLYLLLGLLGAAVGLGAAFDQGTGFNDDLLERADRHELPSPLSELYEHVRTPTLGDHGIYRGTVTSVGTSSIVIEHDDEDEDEDEKEYTVTLPPQYEAHDLEAGDRVYVAGEREDHTIEAYGIDKE